MLIQSMPIEQRLQQEIEESKRWLNLEKMKELTKENLRKELN
jgi:hypothetical protein